MEAETLPDIIWDKFKPTIPDAGMLYRPAPSPIYEPVNEPVVYDALNALKLELKLDILALNEAVAAFNSASVAKVASSDELKFSKLVIRVENEPLST